MISVKIMYNIIDVKVISIKGNRNNKYKVVK